MASSKLYLLPVSTFVLFISTFLITFTIAVCLGHITAVFPYISDAGTFSPESCIFGQLVNIGALLLACTCYIRFRQGDHLCAVYGLGSKINFLNKTAAIIGCISSVGINIVANFQETNILAVHLIAAALGFGGGVVFMVIQTVLSYKFYPLATAARWVLHLRSVMTVLGSITLFICILCGSIAFFQFEGKSVVDMLHWKKEDGGWEFHMASTVTEWILAFVVMSFVLTFTGEFKRIHIKSPLVEVEPADFQTNASGDAENVHWPA